MTNPKRVSVIVPIYKVEAYLRACVESLLAQTYKELEIILVDDGSPDGCPALCEELAKEDPRIKVIHKENGGLSDARNAGLDIATGDYIGFVDSDDAVEPDMFELLVNTLETHDADVSCCRFIRVWEDGREEPVGNDHEVTVYTGTEALKEYLYGKTMDPFVVNKLYKAELLNGETKRRFIKGIIGEDNPFNIEIFKTKPKTVLAGEAKYRYLQARPGAITSSSVSQKKIDAVFFWDGVRRDCETHYPELVSYALRRQALFYIGLYNMIAKDKAHKALASEIRDFIKEHNRAIQESDVCEKVLKLSARLLSAAPWAYRAAMKLYKTVVGEAKL